jgi:hypothetical protein
MKNTLSTFALTLTIPLATAIHAQEPSTENKPAPSGYVGDWSCNGIETDIYTLRDDGTAVHGTDRATWTAADDILELRWNNGYRTVFAGQPGQAALYGKSFVPHRPNSPDNMAFSKVPKVPKIALPVDREFTDGQGRKMAVTILRKTGNIIHVRRASDSKEFDLPVEKLSDDDRKFAANVQEKKLKALVLDDMYTISDRQHSYWFRQEFATAGIEWVMLPTYNHPQYSGTHYDTRDLTAAGLRKYDIIIDGSPADKMTWRNVLKNYEGVVIVYNPAQISRIEWLEDKPSKILRPDPFVTADKNFIFYNPAVETEIPDPSVEKEPNPGGYRRVVAKAVELHRTYHAPALADRSTLKNVGKSRGNVSEIQFSFERGSDMDDSPAYVRLIRIQQNSDKEDRHAVARTELLSKITDPTRIRPVDVQLDNAPENVPFLWYAEVWQNGRIVCKSYNTNQNLEKLPPARTGGQSVKLYPDKTR